MFGVALGSLFASFRANSFRKGLLGGSRFWLSVFIARMVWRQIAKVTKRGEPPVKFSEKLAVGESVLIQHLESD